MYYKIEHHIISKLLNHSPVSKVIYNIRFNTPMLRSGLCDYNNVYIVVKGKNLSSAQIRIIN